MSWLLLTEKYAAKRISSCGEARTRPKSFIDDISSSRYRERTSSGSIEDVKSSRTTGRSASKTSWRAALSSSARADRRCPAAMTAISTPSARSATSSRGRRTRRVRSASTSTRRALPAESISAAARTSDSDRTSSPAAAAAAALEGSADGDGDGDNATRLGAEPADAAPRRGSGKGPAESDAGTAMASDDDPPRRSPPPPPVDADFGGADESTGDDAETNDDVDEADDLSDTAEDDSVAAVASSDSPPLELAVGLAGLGGGGRDAGEDDMIGRPSPRILMHTTINNTRLNRTK